MSNINFQASEKMIAPLVEIMLSQLDQTIDVDATNISRIKKEIRTANRQRSDLQATSIYNQLPLNVKRQSELAKENGASSWLSVIPLSDQGSCWLSVTSSLSWVGTYKTASLPLWSLPPLYAACCLNATYTAFMQSAAAASYAAGWSGQPLCFVV